MYGMKKTLVRNCMGATGDQSDREDLLVCDDAAVAAGLPLHMCTCLVWKTLPNAQELSISMLGYTLEQWTGVHPRKA